MSFTPTGASGLRERDCLRRKLHRLRSLFRLSDARESPEQRRRSHSLRIGFGAFSCVKSRPVGSLPVILFPLLKTGGQLPEGGAGGGGGGDGGGGVVVTGGVTTVRFIAVPSPSSSRVSTLVVVVVFCGVWVVTVVVCRLPSAVGSLVTSVVFRFPLGAISVVVLCLTSPSSSS